MPFEGLISAAGIASNGGKIQINEDKATQINGVFAGGDCVNGGREVVDAVQAGKDAAKGILKYLTKTPKH